jgi:superfamily II DNA/RNA helicase
MAFVVYYDDVDGVYYQEGKYEDAELQVSPSSCRSCDWKILSVSTRRLRIRILCQYRRLLSTHMLTTDLAARGLDIEGITHVHFDSVSRRRYVLHRAGRTGRLGQVDRSLRSDVGSRVRFERLMNALTLTSCIGRQKNSKGTMEE